MKGEKWIPRIVVGLIFVIAWVLILAATVKENYKLGQIDALNGIIKYELIRQDDNTTQWEKIK